MRAPMIVGSDISGGAAVAPRSIGTLTPGASRAGRMAFGTLRERLIRVIGRAAFSMPPSAWLLVDMVTLLVGITVAYQTFPPPPDATPHHIALWQASVIFVFAMVIASLVFGLYERETILSRSRILTRIGLTTTTATVIAYAIIYVLMYATVSRRSTALAMFIFIIGGVSIRVLARWLAKQIHCGLLVIGARPLFESFETAQADGLLGEYRLMGYATLDRDESVLPNDPNYVGGVDDQLTQLGRMGVTDIVVSDSAAQDRRVMDWVVPCLQHGCRVTNEAIFYEKATGQILVDEITPSWFLFADLTVHCDRHATLKRINDVVIAGVALILSAPLWPLIALAVRLCDRGPAFYSQDRVGQNGKVFKLYKFRTMRTDAENGKSIWCTPNDPRVTRVGRFLRKTRLDELPQLWNVLAGHMSVVGPRPERPDIVAELRKKVPFYSERHLVKPGITGWAQISFRYGASVGDAKRKLQFDLYYLKHMSFELDMIILFRTAGTFLKGGC